MWRIAARERVPAMVSEIRRFEVESDGDSVSVADLPTAMLRALAASHGEKH